MATDMAQHNSIMEQFSSLAGNFSFDDDQQVKLVGEAVCIQPTCVIYLKVTKCSEFVYWRN